MPRFLKLLLVAVLCSTTVKGERILETVLDPANNQFQSAKYRSNVLIAGHGDTFMLRYNDIAFSRLLYPIVAGERLKFDTYNNPLTAFEGAIYFSLGPTPGSYTTRYLYRHAGGSFGRVPIPGNIISNCAVYGGNMYFLSFVAGTTRLFRHSAGVTSEVSGAAIPSSALYELNVAGDFLYISGSAGTTPGSGTVN
ncbi:MAG TPA: hypothetical protein VJT83_00660, partial [Chitinophagaceae bacterium]|nr:hypothetical protein [Chitinophagaceae bacterium]